MYQCTVYKIIRLYIHNLKKKKNLDDFLCLIYNVQFLNSYFALM